MSNGYERRKYKRYSIELQISISKMFKQDNVMLDNINSEIKVFDISRTGIGFLCDSKLPINYYFDAFISLKKTDYFYTVLELVRAREENGTYVYGAEFVGLAPFLADKIDNFQRIDNSDLENTYW